MPRGSFDPRNAPLDRLVASFDPAVLARLNRDQRGASWRALTVEQLTLDQCRRDPETEQYDVPTEVSPPPLTWTSRACWIHQLEQFLASARGRLLRLAGSAAGGAERISAERILLVAEAVAYFAEGTTGRWVTAAYSRIAARAGLPPGESTDVLIRKVVRFLSTAGLLIIVTPGRPLSPLERAAAYLFHGGNQSRVAATICLVSPPELVAAAPGGRVSTRRSNSTRAPRRRRPAVRCAPTPATSKGEPGAVASGRDCGPLSSRANSQKESSERSNSPTTRERAAGGFHPHRGRAHGVSVVAPSMAERRLAAALAAPETGLTGLSSAFRSRPGGMHIGALIDLLRRAGVDPERWSATAVKNELDTDGVRSHISWCATPASVLGYLRWRLSRIDWTKPSPLDTYAASRTRIDAQLASRQREFTPRAADDHPLRVAIRQAALLPTVRALAPLSAPGTSDDQTSVTRADDLSGASSSRATSWRSHRRSQPSTPPSKQLRTGSTPERGHGLAHQQTSRSEHRARLRAEWKKTPRLSTGPHASEEVQMT